jgi:ElaB/YqjD/DUF883 family membrane-anchored ribosome-binding protein
MASSTQNRAGDAIDDLRRTAHDVKQSAEAELMALREKVELLMSERVTPAVVNVAGQAEAAARQAVDGVRATSDRVAAEVRAQPLTSLAIAAGLGFLAAVLLRR